jgi:hypothetical protein
MFYHLYEVRGFISKPMAFVLACWAVITHTRRCYNYQERNVETLVNCTKKNCINFVKFRLIVNWKWYTVSLPFRARKVHVLHDDKGGTEKPIWKQPVNNYHLESVILRSPENSSQQPPIQRRLMAWRQTSTQSARRRMTASSGRALWGGWGEKSNRTIIEPCGWLCPLCWQINYDIPKNG